MRRRAVVIVATIIAVLAISAGALAFWLTHRDFRLDAQYYNTSQIVEITIPELEDLIAQKASFLLFVYQSSCSTSDDFEAVLEDFSKERSISILTTNFTALKQSHLVEGLKYYPSAVIYRDGQVVDFLDADSDADLPAYESIDGFTTWLEQNHVNLARV